MDRLSQDKTQLFAELHNLKRRIEYLIHREKNQADAQQLISRLSVIMRELPDLQGTSTEQSCLLSGS